MPKKKLYVAYDTVEEAQAAMSLLGKGDAWHDSIETAQVSPTYSEDLPDMESFEDTISEWNHTESSLLGTGTIANPYSFFRRSGKANSTVTGPENAHEGTYYVYTETTSIGVSKYFSLERTFSAGTGISKMRFYFHMHGESHNANGHMAVETSVDDGQTWVERVRFEGEQHASTTTPYTQVEVDLSDIGNNSFKVRFLLLTGDTGVDAGSHAYRSDMAIDEITFHRALPQTKYLVDAKNGKGFDVLFENHLAGTQEGEYAAAKQAFIAREYRVTEEEKAINGWTSPRFQNEQKVSLRKAAKEYYDIR